MSENASASSATLDKWDKALGWLSAIPLFAIVALTFADVFARYLFSKPIRGSLEIIQFLMALVIFTALPLVTRHRGHVVVSLIDGALSKAARRVQLLVCDAFSLLALCLITWRLWVQAGSEAKESMKTIVLGLPHSWLTYTMTFFACISVFIVFRHMLAAFSTKPKL